MNILNLLKLMMIDLPSLQEYENGVQYSLAQLDERNGASDAVVEGHVFNIT